MAWEAAEPVALAGPDRPVLCVNGHDVEADGHGGPPGLERTVDRSDRGRDDQRGDPLRVRFAIVFVATLAALSAGSAVAARSDHARTAAEACSGGYVDAHLSWGDRCLRVGEFCKIGNDEYHAYGFACPRSGLLTDYPVSSSAAPGPVAAPSAASTGPSPLAVGKTVLLAARTRTSGCVRGQEPRPALLARRLRRRTHRGSDLLAERSAPTRSAMFRGQRSSTSRASTEWWRDDYGYTIEIDHIVPLELGGSNDIANLFPEPGSGTANYHVKDRLENTRHDPCAPGR